MSAPGSADLSRTWAIVPLRGLETAKTRLGGELDPEERLALVGLMFRRTLEATRDARSIAGTVVVTMDPAAAGIAKAHRAVGLVDRLPGLNEAIRAARAVAVSKGATAIVVVPADLARVSAAGLDAFVGAAHELLETAAGSLGGPVGPVELVGLVPDRHGHGTNALLVSPPTVIEPSFGIDSRSVHRSAAVAAGARYLEVGGPLTLDVDTADDLLLAEGALESHDA